MIPQSTVNDIINAMTGKTSYTAPKTVYLGYCANEPNAVTGAVTGEPSSEYYARLEVRNSYETFIGDAAGGVVKNSREIRMPVAREDYGTHYYWFLADSKTGPCFLYGDLYNKNGTKGQAIGLETVPVFYENQLQASIDVPLT